MTSLPIPICPPELAPGYGLGGTAGVDPGATGATGCDAAGHPVAGDEQFLLAAFHSFSNAAASLERSYGNLRAEVESLRAELEETNQKLRREQALAEMSAALAHEIRNPLGSLELFAGLLAEAELESDCGKWVEHLQAGLRTLAATVNNVLFFHSPGHTPKHTPGQRSLPEPASVDLGRLLEWTRDFLLPLARQSGVTFGLQNRLAGICFAADRHRLEQVLLNLVLNALCAMPDGGWIELGGHVARDGQSVELFVADTGPGISPEHLPRLFEPGFSTRSGSPGLGLAVCQRIVSQQGGAIVASTHPNGGALFTVTFPLPDPAANPPATDPGVVQ